MDDEASWGDTTEVEEDLGRCVQLGTMESGGIRGEIYGAGVAVC